MNAHVQEPFRSTLNTIWGAYQTAVSGDWNPMPKCPECNRETATEVRCEECRRHVCDECALVHEDIATCRACVPAVVDYCEMEIKHLRAGFGQVMSTEARRSRIADINGLAAHRDALLAFREGLGLQHVGSCLPGVIDRDTAEGREPSNSAAPRETEGIGDAGSTPANSINTQAVVSE